MADACSWSTSSTCRRSGNERCVGCPYADGVSPICASHRWPVTTAMARCATPPSPSRTAASRGWVRAPMRRRSCWTPAAVVHDGGGCWLTPGLIDCHTHLVYGGNRSDEFEARLNGASYEDIAKAGGGIMSTVRATRAANEDEAAAQSRRALDSCWPKASPPSRSSPATACRSSHEAQAAARGAPPRRGAAGRRARPPSSARTRCRPNSRAAPTTTSPQSARCCRRWPRRAWSTRSTPSASASPSRWPRPSACSQAAQALGLPVKLHAEQLSDQGGAELAARFGALSCDHLEHLGRAGIAAMRAAGTVAVLLPGAYYFLRDTTLPPIAALRAAGVAMAVSTDHNPGTSPTLCLLLMSTWPARCSASRRRRWPAPPPRRARAGPRRPRHAGRRPARRLRAVARCSTRPSWPTGSASGRCALAVRQGRIAVGSLA